MANSLVAYCAGITTVDPIAHDLLFERFLNPARADLPDIDLDFCSRRRDEVLDYVRRTYGAERVALVATVSTLQPRGAVRETAKAYGLDEAADRAAGGATCPARWHPDPRRRDRRTVERRAGRAGATPASAQVVRGAYSLVGQPHHLSVHPGGVVITPGPLTDVVPVQWAPKGFLITQFDHQDVEAIGLPKLDLLGIRALTVLADAERLVRQHHDPAFRLADIPLDDAATADLLARGETIGVFQCESAGARRTLRQLQARTVRDLAVANAFFKPGPGHRAAWRSAFVRRYRGEEPVPFLHPALEPILGPTKGVLIFQEQILRVAREIAGLSWAQADHLRRGMSQFGREEMAAMAGPVRRRLPAPAARRPRLQPAAGRDAVGAGAAPLPATASTRGTPPPTPRQLSLGLSQGPLAGGLSVRPAGRLGRLSPPGHLHGRGGAAGHRRAPAPRQPQRAALHPGLGGRAGRVVDGPGPGARPAPRLGAGHRRGAAARPLCRTARPAAAGPAAGQRGHAPDPVRRAGRAGREPGGAAGRGGRDRARGQRPADGLCLRRREVAA